MWHGAGQFTKSWETTSDGREGYQNIFLRREFGVYLIDQPRRGNAGRSMVQATIIPTPDEQVWFDTFRIGVWPNYFSGVQFSRDPEAPNQFFRSMTPNTGPFDIEVITNAVSALFNRIGPAILVTHSQSGGPGWVAAMKTPNVRAIVAYEPGSNFVALGSPAHCINPLGQSPQSSQIGTRVFQQGKSFQRELGDCRTGVARSACRVSQATALLGYPPTPTNLVLPGYATREPLCRQQQGRG
jgi:pimeloyl-ACP methyl ester carboxylesterase